MSDVYSSQVPKCVLSPLLHILYTDDCQSQYDNRFILKFADDSVIVSLMHDSEKNMALSSMILLTVFLATKC